MKTIIDTLAEYTAKSPNAPILFDDVYTKGITYSQLDDMSGRVYAWLKEKELGKEDFILIDLPRGVLPVVAMIGIWKAGAAFALVEDTYAPDRIDYIRTDCSCKAEISAANWDEILRESPLSGHEDPDPHDAAYAIYTSGTTGKPKGVLHEYGNLGRAIDSIRIDGVVPFNENDRLATLAPMNFVATIIVILAALNVYCGKNYIVSYDTIKNSAALAKFFLGKRITITFLTPSYVRKLGSNTGPFLRMLFVGSEPANNLYNKNLTLINIYAASESGFAVGFFKIDKAYDVCPIGHPQVETEIHLIGEDGNEVADGETGELCFVNPYVRGYINLPEETKNAFRDGLYHTGDLAERDANGDYVLLGRMGDMIKINGNRIEPAEIEAAVKQVLDIDWCAARGFEEEDKSYLCAYYTADVTFDNNVLREELLKRLPYYMIPSYFMKIDQIPLKATGKLDRMALPAPDTSDFQSNYVAPENDTQKAICDAMAAVLKLGRVGIHDDFYEMGGDSLASIDLVTQCNLPGMNTSIIFRGRTPEKMAEMYEKSKTSDDGEPLDEKNAKALQNEYPLTAEQLYMVDYQLYTPNSTMYNLYTMFKVDKDLIDLEQLAAAMDKAIHSHPALLTTFHFRKDGTIVQRYSPEVARELYVEKLTDWEFRNAMKDTLVQPFQIIGGTLYRCRFFETENAGYVFFDVHHTLSDGSSMKVFMADVFKAFMGTEPDPDYYYLVLDKREKAPRTDFYEESRKYFESLYDGEEWSSYPKIDHESRDNEMGELFAPIGILDPQMNAMERAYKISRNEFFITVAGLAVSVYNKTPNVKLSWIYNGREDVETMNTMGLLFRDLPVAFRFRDDDTLRDLFNSVHEQVQGGIEHSCYPYVDLHNQVGAAESAYLLYQRDIRDMDAGGFDIETIDVRQNQAASQTILDMEVLDGSEGLQLMIDFAASRYNEESIERFRDLFVRIAQSLVTHNSQTDVTIREIRDKIEDKKSIFESVKGIFSRKR